MDPIADLGGLKTPGRYEAEDFFQATDKNGPPVLPLVVYPQSVFDGRPVLTEQGGQPTDVPELP